MIASTVCDFCILIRQLMKEGSLEPRDEALFKVHLELEHSRGWQKMEIAI